MNEELQLKLQAYADGELSPGEAREMADLVARDADARALLTELNNTRGALAVYEPEIRLPESREFYWSKIEREIGRLEATGTSRPAASGFMAWRRFLIPAGAVTALVLAAFALFPQLHGSRVTASESSEFTLADSDAFTYNDYANGTTLVWLSYPAEGDFTNIEQDDSLD